jgi:hypothetical protein
MAIIEIAKIQVRRGDAKVTGTPNLDSGEFGWAVAGTDPDSNIPQLFIGNGTEAEGGRIGPGSTRILTQYDNVFNLSTATYTYGATRRELGIALPSAGLRSIQSKLDDFVNVYDFVNEIANEPVTAITLQNAINDLFLYSADKLQTQSRVALRIPAGTYTLSDTVYIPPYATIIGDGQDKTVFVIDNSSKSLFQVCDSDGYLFGDPSFTNATGVNLIGLTLQYGESTSKINALPLLRFDGAKDSYIFNCKFSGSYSSGNTSDAGYAGIDIRGAGSGETANSIIDNCTFNNLYYGIKSNYDIADQTISRSKFKNLRKGIVFRETTVLGNTTGPVRTKITGNKFENIEREGIYVGTSTVPTYNASSYNTFVSVGDSGSGYSVINFLSQGNTSVGDNFRRFLDLNTSTGATFNSLVTGKNYTDHTSVYSSDITTSTVLAKFPYSGDQEYKVQYSVVKSSSGVSRKGEMLINVALIGATTTATITDTYTYAGSSDGGVVFNVGLNTATTTVSLSYTSPDAAGTISYKFSQFQ